MNDGCPSETQLRRWLEAAGKESLHADIVCHIDQCLCCQATLDRLTDDPETKRWRAIHRGPLSSSGAAPLGPLLQDLSSYSPSSWLSSIQEPATAGSIGFPDPPTPQGPLGQLGVYHIVRELGRGATGYVFKAYDSELARTVALKVLRPEAAALAEGRQRFEREARAAVAARHDHIVALYFVGTTPGFALPYLVMEYIEGESLAEYLHRQGISPAVMAARITREIALGLEVVHEHGVIHRDIKPSNILLDHVSGRAKLTDFGLARLISPSDPASADVSRSGGIAGTPAYMSPEQIVAASTANARSDVYSLGVVLYEQLCGALPFRGTPQQILQQVGHADVRSPKEFKPDIARDLETICMKCLEKDPARRYATAHALEEDLRRYLAAEPILARRCSLWERLVKRFRRQPLAATLVTGIGMLVAALLAGGWIFAIREIRQAESEKILLAQAVEARDKSDAALLRQGIDSASRLIRQRRFREAHDQLSVIPPNHRRWEYNRLEHETRLSPHVFETLGGYDWGILDSLSSSDGRELITTGQDGRLLRWDLKSLQSIELRGGIWSPSLRWRHVLYRADKEPELNPAPDCLLKLCWLETDATFASASLHGSGEIWDLRSGQGTKILHHDRPLFAVASSVDGRHLLFGDDRGMVLCHSRSAGTLERRQLSTASIMDIVFCPPSSWIVGQSDGTISLLDLQLKLVRYEEKRDGVVWDLALDQEGTTLAVAGVSLDVFAVHQTGLRQREMYLLPDSDGVNAQAFHAANFSPDGRVLYAGDDQGRLMSWKRPERLPRFVQLDQSIGRLQPNEAAKLILPMQRCIAAIAPHPKQSTVMTAGRATTLRRWSVAERDGITLLRVGRKPQIAFDPLDPKLLWIGDQTGTLAIWDSWTGECVRTFESAHRGAIRAIACSKENAIVATGGADGKLRFWSNDGSALRPQYAEFVHPCGLRSVTLSSNGQRVATYDDNDRVCLWEVATGRSLGQFAMSEVNQGRTVGGLVAFNCDGSRLAVSGPGTSFALFSGHNLNEPPECPYMMAGDGGTAIAWDPKEPNRLFGGDTLGRWCPYPRDVRGPQFQLYRYHQPIIGLSFAPDVSRLAALHQDGVILIHEPQKLGLVYKFRSPHTDPSSIQFDSTGQRLLIAHLGGEVAIWETAEAPAPPVSPARPWSVKTLMSGAQAKHMFTLQAAMNLDPEDRVHLLYTRRNSDLLPGNVIAWHGRETENSFREEMLEVFPGIPNDRAEGTIGRSLSLAVTKDEVFAVFRRPRSDHSATSGELVLVHRGSAGSWEKEILTAPANEGFEPTLLPHPGRSTVWHFAFGNSCLRSTTWTGTHSQSLTVGRQGDGFKKRCVLGNDGRTHVLFFPMRFGDDCSPPVYLRLNGMLDVECREVVAPFVIGEFSLTLDPNGHPIASFCHMDEKGNAVMSIVQRGNDGWKTLGTIPVSELTDPIVTCDASGTLRLAYVDNGYRRLCLATYANGTWHREIVWVDPEAESYEDDPTHIYALATRLDSHGKPVIIFACAHNRRGWLRVFRPSP